MAEQASAQDRRSSIWWIVALGIAALVAMLSWGMVRARSARLEREEEARRRLEVGLNKVKVAHPRRGSIRATLELTGTLRSARDVKVLPEVAGKLVGPPASRGQLVKQGDVLAELESDTFRAQLEQADSAVAVATAALRQAEVARDNARRERTRLKGLEASDAVSRRDVDNAEAMLQSAEAQLQLARAQLEQARAARTLARLQLEKALVRAPFAGVVVDDYGLAKGQVVGPTVPVSRIVDMTDLRVSVRAGERDLPRLKSGQKVELRVAPYGERVFLGKVLVVGPAVDPATRTAELEIAVENVSEGDDWLLKPGMFVRATIIVDERSDIMILPASAIILSDGQQMVLVGKPKAELHVRLDPARMRMKGVKIGDVARALKLAEPPKGYLIRLPAGAADMCRNATVSIGETSVRVSDVAELYPAYVAKLEARSVVLGIRSGEDVEVVSGLKLDELVVTSVSKLLAEGEEVELDMVAEAEVSK